jgi:hypothetical protein
VDANVAGSTAARPHPLIEEKQEIEGPIAKAFKERFPDELIAARVPGRSSITVKRDNIKKVPAR